MPAGEAPKSIKASIYIDGKPAVASTKELTQNVQSLRREMDGLTVGSKEYIEAQEKWKLGAASLALVKQEANNLAEAMKKVAGESSGFFADYKKGFTEIKELVEKVSIGTVIAMSVRGAMDKIGELFANADKAYRDHEVVETTLAQKLKTTGEVSGETVEKLKKYQESLMKQTGIDEDVIATAQQLGLSYTNVRGKIYDQAIPATLDYTAAMNNGRVTTEGVSESSKLLFRALDNVSNAKKSLRAMGITLSAQEEMEINTHRKNNDVMGAQQIILDAVTKRYGGMAVALASTDEGKIQKFDTAFDELSKKIGATEEAGKAALADFFTPMIQTLAETGNAADKASEEFFDQKEKVDELTKSATPLIDRYDELTAKGKLNKAEQKELNEIISSLSQTIPGAVTQWDKYGKALGINTDKARDFIKMQQAMLEIQNKDAIDKTQSMIEDMEGKSKRIQDMLAAGKKVVMQRASPSDDLGGVKTEALSNEDILAASKELGQLQAQIEKATLGIKGLKGENIETPKDKDPEKPTGGLTEAEKEAAQRKADAAKRKKEAEEKAYQELLQQAKEFSAAELADLMSKNDKEVAETQAKFDKMIQKEKDFLKNEQTTAEQRKQITAQIAQFETDKASQIDAVRTRQMQDLTDKIKKFQQSLTASNATELQKQLDKTNEFFDERQKDAGSNYALWITAEAGRQQAIATDKLQEAQNLQDQIEKIEDEGAQTDQQRRIEKLVKIAQQYDDEIEAMAKKYSDEIKLTQAYQDAIAKIEANKKNALANGDKPDPNSPEEQLKKNQKIAQQKVEDASVSTAQNTVNQITSIKEAGIQAEMDAKIKSLEDQKTLELSAANLTANQKAAINDKYNKQEAAVKLQAWKDDQQAKEEQVLMSAAVALMKIFEQSSPVGPTAPIFWADSGILAAQTIAQTAVIEGAKPPAFAGGGATDQDPAGYVNQATIFKRSASGRPFMAGEAGREWVAPSWMLQSPRHANIIGMLESARQEKRSFAAGGSTGAPVSASGDNMTNALLQQLIQEHVKTRDSMNDKKVIFSNTEFKRFNELNAQIENAATL